jgi:hypothetical protein
MSFTGNEDHSITLAAATTMTEDFRDANPGAILGGFFGKTAIEAILNQTDCVGIRYYNALHANGDPTIVLVGVKANQDDLYNGVLAEFAKPMPPFSSSNNPLNS